MTLQEEGNLGVQRTACVSEAGIRDAKDVHELGETQEVDFLELTEGTKLTDTLTLIIWAPPEL